MEKQYKLPSMEFPFHIQVEGKETGITWQGDFVYRRPSLGERSKIEAYRCKLNSDLKTIDDDVALFNSAVSHLRFTIRSYPQWWESTNCGEGLFDLNVVLEIYEKVAQFEADWREKVFGGKPEAVSDSAGQG